jgi:hypothetical protein
MNQVLRFAAGMCHCVLRGVVLTQNLDPNIVMMQLAQDWQRPDVPNCLEVPKDRSVLVQRIDGFDRCGPS